MSDTSPPPSPPAPWRHPAFVAGTLAALLAAATAYIWIDAAAAVHFSGYRDTATRAAFKQIERLGESHWYLVPSGLAALSLLVRRTRLAWRAWFLFAAVAGTGLACVGLKAILGRPRPGRFLGEDAWGFQFFQTSASYWSFPSGHTTTVFAVATALTLLWPRWGFALFPIAAVAGFGRVVTTSHFPADIVAGAWLGVAGTLLLWPRFRARALETPGHG